MQKEPENITVNDTVETVIEYDDEEVEKEEDDVIIDPNLVQIRATPAELNHRILSFIERKRQQVNIVNVQEFCCRRDQNDENDNSCARVDAILIRRKDSKSHVKVHRVLNAWGPQTVDQHAYIKLRCRDRPKQIIIIRPYWMKESQPPKKFLE